MKLYIFLISLFVRFFSHYFNKLEKNKILISYFPAHFSWYNQTLKNIFQLIFHYTTKHQKIIHLKKKLLSSKQTELKFYFIIF